ncbi:hypothetical protein [Hydrogenovibrio marinus]|uniref:Uncharacterized protein n=1 Tax=Hydrogenovibrio marinus TaxID=28885 RepID=A0A066ZNW7_HYDMR|nr:hypothetical protein [Hydrogenovibrio marinus]KDN95518.1 hypothetical protein EI16_04240 [Hydrogenovibrio marinus]BBN60010.1 hypothetical protein HVMH_1604 [Hydrogenovibrio marinus]
MAQVNNTVDPNDLDSIDALLDEAELESVAEEPKPEQEASATPAVEGGELPDAEDVPEDWAVEETAEEDPTAGLLDELDGDLDVSGIQAEETVAPAPEPVLEPEAPVEPPEPAPVSEPPQVDTLSAIQGKDAPNAMEHKAEDILEKRAQAAQAQKANNAIKGPDMDAIKKLIITFSSIIIFLVVVTIGVGIWAALSSGNDLSKETMDKINGIEANSMQSLMHTNASEKTLKTLDKKLDAISFQLEQLNGDIAKIETGTGSLQKTADTKDSHEKAQAAVKPAEPAATAQEPKVAPELAAKLDRVGAQMTSAQRRIYEINQRVKKLQSDYKLLLKSIKSVEKQLVSEKVEKAPAVTGKKGATTGSHSTHNLNIPGTTKPHQPSPAPHAPAQNSPYQYPPSGGYKNNDAYTY